MFGGFVVLLGIAMFAIPAGLMATGFAEEIRRREFMVTWRAVAALPLFAHLDASRIAEIARSEEHTSELQSLMRSTYAVFCLKKKKGKHKHNTLEERERTQVRNTVK